MREAVAFTSDSRAQTVESLARSPQAILLRIALDGGAKRFSGRIEIRLWRGRCLSAASERCTGYKVLRALALADGGRIEVFDDHATDVEWQEADDFAQLSRAADQEAFELRRLVLSLGGFDVVLTTDLQALVTSIGEMPDSVSDLLRLVDGKRAVSMVLADSSYDELLTSQILANLYSMRVVRPRLAGAPISEGLGTPALERLATHDLPVAEVERWMERGEANRPPSTQFSDAFEQSHEPNAAAEVALPESNRGGRSSVLAIVFCAALLLALTTWWFFGEGLLPAVK